MRKLLKTLNIEEITEDEVKRAVDRSRNGKAPGCDKIPNEIYKTGNKAMVCRLTKLFNIAYSTGRIPEEWGKAEICPIYKQKGDYLKCENYGGAKEELEKCMTTWNTAFTKYQLKLNLTKTEVMVINRTPSQVTITLHDIEIKHVKHFKYLGCNVNTNGTIEEEINIGIAKYSQHVGMMYRLLTDRNVPRKAKLVIHKTILRPILLYGHESWVTTKRLDSRIQAADMIVLRLIKGVTRRDKIRNADIY